MPWRLSSSRDNLNQCVDSTHGFCMWICIQIGSSVTDHWALMIIPRACSDEIQNQITWLGFDEHNICCWQPEAKYPDKLLHQVFSTLLLFIINLNTDIFGWDSDEYNHQSLCFQLFRDRTKDSMVFFKFTNLFCLLQFNLQSFFLFQLHTTWIAADMLVTMAFFGAAASYSLNHP